MDVIVKRIRRRLHQRDQNFLCLFCGPTGSGKSESSISLALAIHPKFKAEYIVFSVEEFFRLINSGRLKPGDCIVWEEMGVSSDSRSFFTLQNKAINYCFETFRALNLAIIMNLPSLGMVDANVKKLSHMYFETVRIDYNRKVCVCRQYNMQHNPRTGKIYYKYPKAVVQGVVTTLSHLEISKPPDHIVAKYKSLKNSYIKTLNRDMEAEILQKKSEKDRTKIKDTTEFVQKIMDNLDKWIVRYRGKYTVNAAAIAGEFGIGMPTATKVKYMVEHKISKNSSYS